MNPHSNSCLKRIRDMTRTYSQMHHMDKYSEYRSIIRPVSPNGWVFVYKLSGSGFESSCSHLNFRFWACFEQGVPWHSGNYRVWIYFWNTYVTWQEHIVKCTIQISTQNTAQSFGLLAKWLSVSLPTKWFWVQVQLQLLKLQILHLLWARSSLTLRQL